MTELDGSLIYGATGTGSELFVYDGNTITSYEISLQGDLFKYDGALYFKGSDATYGWELWKYDGTGISLVEDINPGTGNSSPGSYGILNNVLYFAADDASADRELWKHDGTTTSLAANISTSPSLPVIINNDESNLYMVATTPAKGRELWKYDGINPPEVIDINPGSSSSIIGSSTMYQGKLIFGADNGTKGQELWSYDGTSAVLFDIFTGTSGSNPSSYAELNGILYFSARDMDHGFEIFKYDGTAVTLATDVIEGSGDSNASDFFSHGPYLYFQVSNFGPSAASVNQSTLAAVEELNGLWRYDGTSPEYISEFFLDEVNDPTLFLGNYAYLDGFTHLTGTELFKIRAISEGTDIITFSFAEQTGEATINTTDHTISIEVAFGTDLTNLVPTIEVSEFASISPETAVAQDFISTVTYTVTSEFGNTQDWMVTVTVTGNNAPSVTNALTEDQTLDEGFGSDTIDLTSTFSDADNDCTYI